MTSVSGKIEETGGERRRLLIFIYRALKSVLVMAGNLKRSAPDMSEDMVIMRALRDMNLPKFVFDDVPLFKGLLADLFPDLAPPRLSYKTFKEAVEAELTKKDYLILPEQVDKVCLLSFLPLFFLCYYFLFLSW